MTNIKRPLAYARANSARFLAELQRFVRIPTVSGEAKHARDVTQGAQWLAGQLRQAGLKRVRIVPTDKHPFVYAEWTQAPGRPTVLIYGHYDVQPVAPLAKWRTPPFEPQVRGKHLYGRGASDDKGPLLAHVKAIESYLKTLGHLPVNVKCIFEGEEEIGSPNLPPYVARNRDALAADVAAMSDTRMLGPNRPAISYSERGSLAVDLELRGGQRSLHGGQFGGAVHNSLQALCGIIAGLHDHNRRVAIPGFYDRVRRWSRAERAHLARVGPTDAQLLRDAKTGARWGEPGYTLYESTTIRPALLVKGITDGSGGKSGLPAKAVASLSFRLAADQDPQEIEALLREHVARVTPPGMQSAVRVKSRAKPIVIDRKHPAMRAALAAYRRGFGVPAVFIRSGGTVPLVVTFYEVLRIPTVLMGFALPDDRIHAPNERFYLPNYTRGIATCIWFLAELARMPGRAAIKGQPAARRGTRNRSDVRVEKARVRYGS